MAKVQKPVESKGKNGNFFESITFVLDEARALFKKQPTSEIVLASGSSELLSFFIKEAIDSHWKMKLDSCIMKMRWNFQPRWPGFLSIELS